MSSGECLPKRNGCPDDKTVNYLYPLNCNPDFLYGYEGVKSFNLHANFQPMRTEVIKN